MTRLLVAEDDMDIRDFLERGLRGEGYQVDVAKDGLQAYELGATGDYDLIILDLGLPFIDGQKIVQKLRERGVETQVIVLTARSSVAETVRSFEGGANDFMAKPFQFAELAARIRARLREHSGHTNGHESDFEDGLVVDEECLRVKVKGQWVDLPPRELALLQVFRQHIGQVLSRRQLLALAWGSEVKPASNLVDVYVRTLRTKIGSDRFTTVRGVGYQFD